MLTDSIINNMSENGVQIIPYDSYEIGDVVSFAGSNWYVIEDSLEAQDYVVLLKEVVLTAEELTNNYSYKHYGSVRASMSYYWDEICHGAGTFGTDIYDTTDDSGCSGHNDYEGSKVREMLEGTYINTLGASNLKEVDGYKIRLITIEELRNTFGYNNRSTDATPAWVYGNYGSTFLYWTMTPYSNTTVFLQ